MKKIVTLAGILCCITFTGCTESDQPDFTRTEAQRLERKQKINLMQYKSEAVNFLEAADQSVVTNEQRIAKLFVRASHQNDNVRGRYEDKIIRLEQKNNALKIKIEEYETNDKIGWKAFRYACETELGQLSNSIKRLEVLDLTIANN